MGEQVAAIITIMVLIIAVVAVVALGFGMFTTSKKQANGTQNELVTQLDTISKAIYTDLDQQVVTGIRLKGVVDQVKTADCAVMVGTLGLFGSQLNLMDTPAANQTSLNGQVEIDLKAGKAPFVRLEGMNVKTSLDTTVQDPYVINYGTILKNGVTGVGTDKASAISAAMAVTDATAKTTSIKVDKKPTVYSGTALGGYNQTIEFKDGTFTTKLDYLTNDNSQVIRYDSISDFGKSGKTMSISDTAQFNSYVVKSADGDYRGLVFLQIRK